MKKISKKNKNCLICHNTKLSLYLTLGNSAIANSYLPEDLLKKPEFVAPLRVYYCHNCHLAQLLDIIDRNYIFGAYPYFSSTSPQLVTHFEKYAKEIFTRFPKQAKKLTFDIGSNDGILLKPLKQMGANVLGIDPAKNVTAVANKDGIETISDFFGTSIVPVIEKKYGKAGIITANNVLAHTDKVHDVIAAIKKLLDNNGVFVFETQYLVDLMQKNEFDNTYHEHICYYSLHSLLHLLKQHDMEAFDIQQVSTHGGSLRIYASHSPLIIRVNPTIEAIRKQELAFGINRLKTYQTFAKRSLKIKKTLSKMLLKLKKQGKKIAGYGAPAKATTLLNYCNIDATIISYITDNAPSKQNLYMPGTHIPIVSPKKIKEDIPDYILILAWNYAESIIEKEAWFRKNGGKFIIPIPTPTII